MRFGFHGNLCRYLSQWLRKLLAQLHAGFKNLLGVTMLMLSKPGAIVVNLQIRQEVKKFIGNR